MNRTSMKFSFSPISISYLISIVVFFSHVSSHNTVTIMRLHYILKNLQLLGVGKRRLPTIEPGKREGMQLCPELINKILFLHSEVPLMKIPVKLYFQTWRKFTLSLILSSYSEDFSHNSIRLGNTMSFCLNERLLCKS